MRSQNCQSGFTLIETLIASSILAMIMVAAFLLHATNNTAYLRGQSRAEVNQNARVALDGMAREIRVAGYDRSGVITTLTQATPVQTAQSGRLVFVADVDRDGTLDLVDYQRSGNQLTRGISSWGGSAFPAVTNGVLADGLALLNFSYFDDTDTAIAAPVASADLDDIRRITISLVTTETAGREQAELSLVQDVRLRN